MRSRELSHGPYRVVVARAERVAYYPRHLRAAGHRLAEPLQKNVIPVEHWAGEAVVLGRPLITTGHERLADAVAVHVAGDDYQRISGGIGHDHLGLIAPLRRPDIARRAEVGAVDADLHVTDHHRRRCRDALGMPQTGYMRQHQFLVRDDRPAR